MSLQHLPASGPLQSILDALESDGGLIVEGMFAIDVVSGLRNDILNAADSFEAGAGTQGSCCPLAGPIG